MLRYSCSRQLMLNSKSTPKNNSSSITGRSYASVLKSTLSSSVSIQKSVNQSSPPPSKMKELKTMLITILQNIKKTIKHNFEILHDAIYIIKYKQDDSSHIQEIVNQFHTLAASNNTSASDSCIHENFSILLKGFNLLQKELYQLFTDMSILKAYCSLTDSDDKDYEDEGDDHLTF